MIIGRPGTFPTCTWLMCVSAYQHRTTRYAALRLLAMHLEVVLLVRQWRPSISCVVPMPFRQLVDWSFLRCLHDNVWCS